MKLFTVFIKAMHERFPVRVRPLVSRLQFAGALKWQPAGYISPSVSGSSVRKRTYRVLPHGIGGNAATTTSIVIVGITIVVTSAKSSRKTESTLYTV